CEALTDHVLHHEELVAPLDEEVVDQDEIRVAKAHGDARLALEALECLGHGAKALGPNHLEGADLPQKEVLYLVDGAHAAASDLFEDPQIARLPTDHRIGDRFLRTVRAIAHGASCSHAASAGSRAR